MSGRITNGKWRFEPGSSPSPWNQKLHHIWDNQRSKIRTREKIHTSQLPYSNKGIGVNSLGWLIEVWFGVQESLLNCLFSHLPVCHIVPWSFFSVWGQLCTNSRVYRFVVLGHQIWISGVILSLDIGVILNFEHSRLFTCTDEYNKQGIKQRCFISPTQFCELKMLRIQSETFQIRWTTAFPKIFSMCFAFSSNLTSQRTSKIGLHTDVLPLRWSHGSCLAIFIFSFVCH